MPFLPSEHGFPFPNCWPKGTPVVEVPTPFGTIPIGDAAGGVCGGMIFAAADYYLVRRPRPAEAAPALLKYFCRRLLESWQLPFGMLRYYGWQCRPTATRVMSGVQLVDGTMPLTQQTEWPRVKRLLDAGGLAPLGLVKPDSWNPLHMGRHHQVLAYSYEPRGPDVVLRVYDPNYPNDDSAALTVSGREIHHSCEGPTVRGFFLTDYTPREPPP